MINTGKQVPPNGDQRILRLSGVPGHVGDDEVDGGFVRDPQGGWRQIGDASYASVEMECVGLHQELAAKIFGDIAIYYALLPSAPSFFSVAGLNSESSIGRNAFEKLLGDLAQFPELYRFLYLYDVRSLVSAIQEGTKEVDQLTGEFYRILNLEQFFAVDIPVPDGLRWSTSPSVTMLNSTIGFIFIRLHSLLDYFAKLTWEVENLQDDFTLYPRLASTNFLFGQRRRLQVNRHPGSLFEACEVVDEVELVRNLLIHDGLLDDMPKAYEMIADGVVKERFVLFPDKQKGRFERFKNRHRFYAREDKINLRLVALVREFQSRSVETLRSIRRLL